MRNLPAYRITFDDGDTVETSMAHGITLEAARDYYIGHDFPVGTGEGGDERTRRAVSVEPIPSAVEPAPEPEDIGEDRRTRQERKADDCREPRYSRDALVWGCAIGYRVGVQWARKGLPAAEPIDVGRECAGAVDRAYGPTIEGRSSDAVADVLARLSDGTNPPADTAYRILRDLVKLYEDSTEDGSIDFDIGVEGLVSRTRDVLDIKKEVPA